MLTEALFILMLHLGIPCDDSRVICLIHQTPVTVIVESCVDSSHFMAPHTPSVIYRTTLPDGRLLEVMELGACCAV